MVALWFAVDKKLAQQVFFVTATSLSVNGIIKNFAKVPRPFTKGVSCVRLDTATGYAFPSGHTQTAVGTFGCIAYTAKNKIVKFLCVNMERKREKVFLFIV